MGLAKRTAVPSTAVSATLAAASWVGSAAPFTQDVNISGIISSTEPNGIVGLSESATAAQKEAAAEALLSKTSQDEGIITIRADGAKPAIDIPITVILLG